MGWFGRKGLPKEQVDEVMKRLAGMPEVDSSTSRLFHAPVFDCRRKRLVWPCAHPTFDEDLFPTDGTTTGAYMDDMIEIIVRGAAEDYPVIAFVPAADHLVILGSADAKQCGAQAYRLIKTTSFSWYVYSWLTGFDDELGSADPVFWVRDMAKDPDRWLLREEAVAHYWSTRRSGSTGCKHFPNAGSQL